MCQSRYRLTMASEADMMLRGFIVELADKVIASNVYSGAEFDLANFLSGYIYSRAPADIRDSYAELKRAVEQGD